MINKNSALNSHVSVHLSAWERQLVLYYLDGFQSWFLKTFWETQLLPAVFADATKTVDIWNNEEHRSLGSKKRMFQCSET